MTANSNQPDFLLFAQHGWADTGQDIAKLANAVATPQTIVVAPSLGLVKTFIRIKPLVLKLEQIAAAAIKAHPHIPVRIMGHSMGGLMWLEVLNRNRQWWNQVHSLVLLGSPVGGSNVARLLDPLGLGIGTAKDLGANRRSIAEEIAQQIPTLAIASDMGMGTDGLVTVENTKFTYANWMLVNDIPHHLLKCHSQMIAPIQNFWANPQLGKATEDLANRLIRYLRSIPGMTDADYAGLGRSQTVSNFAEDITLRTWKNSWGVNHIYLVQNQTCLYAGYVGLIHNQQLAKAIADLQQDV